MSHQDDKIKIQEANLKDGLFLSVKYLEIMNDGNNKVKKDCKMPVHEDLISAFAELNEHLAQLSFQYDKKGKLDYENVECTGFSLAEKDGEVVGVSLNGTRNLESKKDMLISTPTQRYVSDAYRYKKIDELEKAVDECYDEVYRYLFEGKHAPEAQGQLKLAGEDEDDDLV